MRKTSTAGRSLCLAILLGAAQTPAWGEAPLAVTVIRAESAGTVRVLSLTGELMAPETLSASFPTGGRIAEMMVDDGDRVAAGDTLARIDRVQQEQALRSAEAQLAATSAEFATARDDDTRQAELFQRGATTRAARDAAADRLAAAVARRAQAEAALEQARDALADTVLLAPQNATVIRRLAEPGQVVGAAQPVFELAQGQGYEAVFDVPESVLTDEAAPNPVITLSPVDRPEITVTGQVSEISPIVDPASGTVAVKVALDADLPGLSYGDAVRGRTGLGEGEHISLPWSAISATKDGPAVWVVDPDTSTVSLRQISIRRYTSGEILLNDGVASGETVVRQGTQLLYPGRVVRIVEETK
ncbi:efflux RND transporter periplasmic adaptor subunit [Puniceibacterium confluentis]|uniref:efflux RND transporter periplasmic adaptor subunit n=1 Tax=Puniceibacterium confluentis TaxID=1958944 RepID=UPI0011B5B42A|nr:efflux RND transporter periplasmic adaptor subunit [Puniceibacterium confluentis]